VDTSIWYAAADAVDAHSGLAGPGLLGEVKTEGQRFAGAVQSDDRTRLVARATVPAEAVADRERATDP